MRYAFAGDRQIAVNILNLLLAKGHRPKALLVTNGIHATHKQELCSLAGLDKEMVFEGKDFTNSENIEKLKALALDYIFGIHFPYIIPSEVLTIPRIGFLNLHPAYLPYNKGWHTPSWAILDGTPYGATLHFMSVALDKGDIIYQEKLEVLPNDTANSLYEKVLLLEEKVFQKALPELESLRPNREGQTEKGSAHTKKDLKAKQELELDEPTTAGDLIDRLRALTTNTWEEAAYFKKDGKKYKVQIVIQETEE
ncbi:formyltransferase family protein [Altibacter sp.]|uniref:methionyl-tRNA formyltransferase n=1 Tax=Altibacter sp. TaxID=2024823 RepID=UPI000C8AF800|nr:formyltransferase family protein [Altibacter sp.]MAP55567.1 hypothetical protein [Altibacter sp.]